VDLQNLRAGARMTDAVTLAAFFGKVPARGDFVSRGGPGAILPGWEGWLDQLVVAARDALGDAWPDDWLTAPLWHFLLGAHVLPPVGGAGIFVASADRVGRCYPLTLIARARGGDAAPAVAAANWGRSAEALMLSALEDDFDPDQLDTALQALGSPAAQRGVLRVTGHWPLTFAGDSPVHGHDQSDDTALHPPGADQTRWFSRGSHRVPPMHLRCDGLPNRRIAAAMISGAFDGGA
jgi:type VI secretion system protein ImpM